VAAHGSQRQTDERTNGQTNTADGYRRRVITDNVDALILVTSVWWVNIAFADIDISDPKYRRYRYRYPLL